MIKILDLVKLGQWLNENDVDSFGKQIKDNDCILLVDYKNEFTIKDIYKMSELDLKILFDNKSCYVKDCFISTDQRIMIPSKSNLMGLSPFCLKLDHDFIKKDNINEKNIEKFKNKVHRSLDANKNAKEFVYEIEHLYNNEELLNSPLSSETKKNLTDFFSKHDLDKLKEIIITYYQFIEDNVDLIIGEINEYKESEKYNKKDKSNFYLVCAFNNDFDLLNDIFYYYSKFIKVKNKFSGNPHRERCVICGKNDITVPSSGSFVSEKYYFFNNNTSINNSHLKLCKNCNSFMSLAEDKLKKSMISNIYLIPKSREENNYNLDKFIKILNMEDNDFSKLNEMLYNEQIIDYFDLDLAIYTHEQGDSFPIRKYVENYRSYLIKFDEIKLLKDSNLNYLFDEYVKINSDRESLFKFENIFDIERIFKNFFTYVDSEGNTQRLILKYFYQIYSKDFNGKGGITYNLDSNTTALFSKYMQNIFNFIYELNFNALTKQDLDEIVLNCIQHYVKVNYGESYGKYNYTIKERLNEYYMLMNEFWGIHMFDKENIKLLKEKFIEFKKEDDFDEFKQEVIPLIESSAYIKYYIIGQFIRYIDNFKKANGFNPEVFNNFMTNVNRNNAKKMFATEILQKNIFYINKMNKKGKLLFELLEENMDSLFNEDDMTYEDYILTLCTGYYTENILSNKKEEKNEGE